MPRVLQLIIRRPYSDVSGVVERISTVCDRLLCCQHDADDEITQTHIHAMLVGATVSDQSIRNWVTSADLGGKGQFSLFDKTQKKPRREYEEDYLGPYLLKGTANGIKYNHGYSDEIIASWIVKWNKKVQTKIVTPLIAEQMEFVMEQAEQKALKRDAFGSLLADFEMLDDCAKVSYEWTKKWIMSYYLKKRLPIPRSCDINRYAYSMVRIARGQDDVESQEIQ